MIVKSRKSRAELVREARAKRALIQRIARNDMNTFAEYILKDEKTGKPIQQSPTHLSWHIHADENPKLLIWSHIESGKTQQMAIARTLWELGRDPSLRYLLLSNTKGQARKLASSIRGYIETSSELHDVFPDLKPGNPWGEYSFSVERATIAKDASVATAGIHGNILGSRLDRVLLDDVLDYENTKTEDQRKGLIDWWLSTVAGRVVDGGRTLCIGTAFHPQDMLHFFARQEGWKALKYPVIDPLTGEPRWPERWPLERIAAKIKEIGPIEAARQLYCEARDDSTARFKREWIELGLRLGEGTQLASALTVLPPGYKTYTGVDLAVQKTDAADKTCLFTIAVDPFGSRSVLNIESGKWSGPEIVGKIVQAHTRYQSIVVVENNAAQDFIRQFTIASHSIPIIPFTTGRNKAHPEFGVESIAAEMAAGKWKIPNRNGSMNSEVREWVDEMLFYDPAAHTGDRLMACWFAREGARMGTRVDTNLNVDFNRR